MSPGHVFGRRCALAATLLALVAGSSAARADEASYGPVSQDLLATRFLDLPSPTPLGRHVFEVSFTHRFQESFQDGSGHDLWGLDSGADVGLGFAFGLTEAFDFSLYRSSFAETFELAGRFALYRQAPRVPFTVTLRAGADVSSRTEVEERTRPFAQLLLARRFAPGWNLVVAPSWVRDTPRLRNAWNVPIGVTSPLPGGSLLVGELVPKNRDLDTSVTAWSVGWSKAVGLHVFEISLGNTRATTVDQMLGGDFAGGFATGDVRLGFNLIRKFKH